MPDSYLERLLGRGMGELLNDGRIGPRTDHLLCRLESDLGAMPVGHLLDLLGGSPWADQEGLRELRAALADDALAVRDYELG